MSFQKKNTDFLDLPRCAFCISVEGLAAVLFRELYGIDVLLLRLRSSSAFSLVAMDVEFSCLAEGLLKEANSWLVSPPRRDSMEKGDLNGFFTCSCAWN